MEQDKNKTFGTRIILAIEAGKDSDRGNKWLFKNGFKTDFYKYFQNNQHLKVTDISSITDMFK